MGNYTSRATSGLKFSASVVFLASAMAATLVFADHLPEHTQSNSCIGVLDEFDDYNTVVAALNASSLTVGSCLLAGEWDAVCGVPSSGWLVTMAFENIGVENFPEYHTNCYVVAGGTGAGCPTGMRLDDNTGTCVLDVPNLDLEAGEDPCEEEDGVVASDAPIYFGSGNKYLAMDDYRGSGIMPLGWSRSYNSLDGVWRFSYQQRLESINQAAVLLRQSDGKGIEFRDVYLANDWIEPTGTKIQLEHDAVADEWTVMYLDDSVDVFNSDGQLLSSSNRNGQSTTIAYSNGLPSTITHFTGRTLTLTHDASDRVSTVTDPSGNTFSYTYDANGMLEFVIYPDDTPGTTTDNPRIQYHYEDSNNTALVTGMTDELGIRYTTYAYDSEGRATLSERAGNVEATSVVYNADGTVTETNKLGKDTIYTFVLTNGVRKVASIDGQPTPSCLATTKTQTYDTRGFTDTRTDAEGNVTDYTYNSRGLVESKTEASGTADARTTTTTWHTTLRVPTQIVRPGQTVDMTYDSEGRLLTRTITDTQSQSIPYSTNGNTRVWTYTYHPTFGLVTSIDGPRTGDTTNFTYDANGDLATTTNAEGHVTTIVSRDARGLPTRIEDPNGVDTVLAYDERGRLTSRTVESSQGNAVTSFTYDDASQLISVTLPNGSSLDYDYDNAHRLVAIENNLGERVEYTLDNAGNRTGETIRNSASVIVKTQTRLFDELSRLREDIGAQSQTTSYDYDLNDNLDGIEDALLDTTTQSFDALDRLISVTDPDLNSADYDYDDRDNLTQVTDPRGIITSFVYDGLDNLIQEDSADAGISVHLYDAAGNRTQTTDARGVVAQMAYDGLSRLTSVTYPASTAENITYTYDTGTNGEGRLTSMTDESGSTSYTYDDRGNIMTQTRVIGAASYVTSYTYDLADNVLTVTYPSGRIVNYGRDALGRVDTVTTQTDSASAAENVATNITYLPFGPADGWTFGNGSIASRVFDSDYRITDLLVTTSGSAGVIDRDYLYNPVNNITGITNALDGTRSQTFTYDSLYRLTQAVGIYGTFDYSYDEVGNRTVKTINSTDVLTYNYATTSNRLLSVDEAGDLRVFTYDAAGNVVIDDRGSGPGLDLEYNDRNRLVETEVTP